MDFVRFCGAGRSCSVVVHRQVQAGSECVSRFDATVQTEIGQDDLDLVLIGSRPWNAVVLPQIRRELQLVG